MTTQLFAVTVQVFVDAPTLQSAECVQEQMRKYLLEQCVNFSADGVHFEFSDGARTVQELALTESNDPNVA